MDHAQVRRILRPISGITAELVLCEADLDDPRHAQALVLVLDSYARDPMGIGHSLPPEVRANIVSGLREHPTSLVFLAFAFGEPAGAVVCFRGFSTFTATPVMNVHDLAVRPGFRGRRIAHELLLRVEDKARDLGCTKLTLEVREDNQAALRLYRRVGFLTDDPAASRPHTMFLEKPL